MLWTNLNFINFSRYLVKNGLIRKRASIALNLKNILSLNKLFIYKKIKFIANKQPFNYSAYTQRKLISKVGAPLYPNFPAFDC